MKQEFENFVVNIRTTICPISLNETKKIKSSEIVTTHLKKVNFSRRKRSDEMNKKNHIKNYQEIPAGG